MKILAALLIISVTAIYVYAFSSGITGVTRKNGSGCVCHGLSPSPDVMVSILGPDTIFTGDTSEYSLTITGGPLVRGGTNIAVIKGSLIPGSGLRILNGELTHLAPLIPDSGIVSFMFRYIAPSIPGTDTIFANGNSVNFDGFSNGDKWNFAPDKKIFITPNTRIINEHGSKIDFHLGQNYPNPFNPETTIDYSLTERSSVMLQVFDCSGKEISLLIDEKQNPGNHSVRWNAREYSSGVYYYRLKTADNFQTKQMLFLK